MSGDQGCGCYGGCAPSLTTDPAKRVHYAQGQVLGVDEFVQAEYYLLEGARRHHRMLHGAGTVCGLGVSARDTETGVEIRVEPGHAIDTHGREIRVGAAQCAQLADWLSTQAAGEDPLEIPEDGQIGLWVTLCYRECLTDLEPIPGAPCRTPDEATVATRVTESFALRFDRDRPDMRAVDAVRAFARLLRRITPVPDDETEVTVADLEDLVASLAGEGPDLEPDETLPVPEARVTAYLDAAFRTWVTVVRPAIAPEGSGCADGPGGDGCIALARIGVPVEDDGAGGIALDGTAGDVTVEDAGRPVLLPTQLLQELLMPGGGAGGVEAHDALTGLTNDDHPQYLLVERRNPGAPPAGPDDLLNDLSGGGNFRLRGLPEAAQDGDAMPSGQTAGGDLSGTLPDPTVTGLHGLPVPQPQSSDEGRHLTVVRTDGGLGWRLMAPSVSGGGGPAPEAGEEGLVRLQATSWLHNAPSDLSLKIADLDNGGAVPGLAVAFGIEKVGDAVVLIGKDMEAADNPRSRLGARNDLGSLDIHSFRVFAEVDDPRLPGTRARLRIVPENLVPIEPDLETGQTVFTSAKVFPEAAAPGAMLILNAELRARLLESNAFLWVELDGDHILGRKADSDDPPRAVDMEFLRSRLPSGDRPEGAERGTQGGLFTSWINRASQEGFAAGGLDINRVDFGVLSELGLTRTAANRFLQRRDESRGVKDLSEIAGMSNVSATARRILENPGVFYVGSR